MTLLKFFRGKSHTSARYAAEFSAIFESYEAHKPSLIKGSLSGERWRHESMGKTLNAITDLRKYEELKKHAAENLTVWAQTKSEPPSEVEVVYQDWGDAAKHITRKYARLYAVLNMSNSLYPGGGSLEGGSAQEENMWHRSTCARSLIDDIVTYDKDYNNTFLYTPKGKELVEGRRKMTEEELKTLEKRCKEAYSPNACKTFYSEEPRICFRGPEVLLPPSMDDYGANKVADPDMSFPFLPPTSIFSFHELRSAAPEHFAESHSKAPEVVKEHREDVRRRIAAQLDTLILAGKPYALLGAWGCGEFKNEPEVIAEIYAEEIEKRASFFQHIMFPIINTHSQHNNFDIFEKILTGIKLGEASSPQSSLRS
ncbi:Uncharacterized protein conserved in bacteria [Legionella steigerwaltii]|uniref:Uncharacterized protein conserved in bacteria n=1 Tax=Legionella steigerwaltii TaxID=460 RepID=A0A378L7S0_9GAMM|nr:poly(ADP-ribose) glycohydrolase domain-containing protein [Legionella steigerwaltii]KTD69959.1 hypothetical protein Lstg_3400 [Legionella steigerwaltii]STY21729.1 Uncharacterized protein conserved in bacteria [Legionella steigerwaltii]